MSDRSGGAEHDDGEPSRTSPIRCGPWAGGTAPPIGGVLVGGRSRRYGRPKGAVRVGGVSMVERALDALRPHAAPLYLAGRPPGGAPVQADGDGAASTVVLSDLRRSAGPLAGVEALLAEGAARGAPGALVLPCDLPLLGAEVVGLLARIAAEDSERVVVASGPEPDRVHPLCGYWPAVALAPLRAILDRGGRAAREAARELGARVVGPDEVAAVADPALVFLNVNTPAARERVEALLEGR